MAEEEEPYPRFKTLYFSGTFELHVEEYKDEDQDMFVILMAGEPRVYIPKHAADQIARFILFKDERD